VPGPVVVYRHLENRYRVENPGKQKSGLALFCWSGAVHLETIGAMKTPYLILALIASAATALAVDPPPDGGYPNQNTAEGQNALLRLRKGTDNTALGFEALVNHTSGNLNTAVGSGALHSQEKAGPTRRG
jgi:hypothetical protein